MNRPHFDCVLPDIIEYRGDAPPLFIATPEQERGLEKEIRRKLRNKRKAWKRKYGR